MHRHAPQYLRGGLGQQRIGQCAIARIGHPLHGLLQVGVMRGARGATVASLKAQPIQVIQLGDSIHPPHRPSPQRGIVVAQPQEVAPLVRPAKCQHDPRVQSRKLLVRHVAVAANEATVHAGQLGFDHCGRP